MTSRVALVGHHIGYSASPAMHNAAFRALGFNWRYELADVSTDELPGIIELLRAGAYRGANVTQPHKQQILSLLEELSPQAHQLQAVNTITIQGQRLMGHNTDLPALTDELAAKCPKLRSAVILGRGGAAVAAAAAVERLGGGAVLVGRSDWPHIREFMATADVLINATPIGMNSQETPIPAEWLRSDLAVLDLAYRPHPTRLVCEARAIGAKAWDGAGVLLRQAALSFALWTGLTAPAERMKQALEAELAVNRNG